MFEYMYVYYLTGNWNKRTLEVRPKKRGKVLSVMMAVCDLDEVFSVSSVCYVSYFYIVYIEWFS